MIEKGGKKVLLKYVQEDFSQHVDPADVLKALNIEPAPPAGAGN